MEEIVRTVVHAPQPEEMQPADTQISVNDETVPAKKRQSLLQELGDKQNYLDCLDTCFFFCCTYAILNLILSITVCCRCCACLFKVPEYIKTRTARTHCVVAFLARVLSSLWVTSVVVLFARWALFRPFDVKPHLGASTLHQFELTSTGDLRFNVTAFVLLRNEHAFYKIHYHYFAASFMYADVKLGPADDGELPFFRQKPQESTVERLPFVGRLRNATASGTVGETLARETADGLLRMLLRIRVSLNYGFWPFKGDYFIVYDCPLIAPVPRMGMGEPGALSSPARCKTVHV